MIERIVARWVSGNAKARLPRRRPSPWTTSGRHHGQTIRIDSFEVGRLARGSGDEPSDGEQAIPSQVRANVAAIHGVKASVLTGLTSREVRALHVELHSDGADHRVIDIREPLLPAQLRHSSVMAELADLRGDGKQFTPSDETLSFIAARRAQRERETAEARQLHDLWIENSKRAQGMRDVSFAEEVEREQKERRAWMKDRGIVEGEIVRLAYDAPSGPLRISTDDLLDGEARGGEMDDA